MYGEHVSSFCKRDLNFASLLFFVGACRFTLLFKQFAFNALALELREVVHEELAVEVINFMLDAHCQQAFCFDGAAIAMLIKRRCPHACSTFYAIINSRHRQAAFIALNEFFAHPLNFWIDKRRGVGGLF